MDVEWSQALVPAEPGPIAFGVGLRCGSASQNTSGQRLGGCCQGLLQTPPSQPLAGHIRSLILPVPGLCHPSGNFPASGLPVTIRVLSDIP